MDERRRMVGLSHAGARCLLKTGTSRHTDQEVKSNEYVAREKKRQDKYVLSRFSLYSLLRPFHFYLFTYFMPLF